MPGGGGPRHRRRRLTATLLAVILAALTGFAFAPAAAAQDQEYIRSFTLDVVVGKDGSLQVREEIAYHFGSNKRHGLKRVLTVRTPYDRSHDRSYPVQDLKVTSPTGASTKVKQDLEDEESLAIYIGDSWKASVTGDQIYVLQYRVPAVVDDVTVAGRRYQRFSVDATGWWTVPIEHESVTLSAPGLFEVDCSRGAESTTTCPVSLRPGQATVSLDKIDHREWVTLWAFMPPGAVAARRPILIDTFSPAEGFRIDAASLSACAGVLVLGVGAVLLAFRRRRRLPEARRPDGVGVSIGRRPGPPEGAPPGVLGAVLNGSAEYTDVVATMLDLARRGHLKIEDAGGPLQSPDNWTIRRCEVADPMSPAELQLMATLFEWDSEFTRRDQGVTNLSDLRGRSYGGSRKVQRLLEDDAVHRGWFVARSSRQHGWWVGIGLAVLALGVVATTPLAVQTGLGFVGLDVILIGLLILVLTIYVTPLTPAGRATLEDIRGYTSALRGKAEVQGGYPQGWPEDLPYRVALAGHAWSRVPAEVPGHHLRPAPKPDWYATAGDDPGFDVAVFAQRMCWFSIRSESTLFHRAGGSDSGGSSGGDGGGGGGGGGGSF